MGPGGSTQSNIFPISQETTHIYYLIANPLTNIVNVHHKNKSPGVSMPISRPCRVFLLVLDIDVCQIVERTPFM